MNLLKKIQTPCAQSTGGKKKRPRFGKVLPPPLYSARKYVRISCNTVHLFLFFLEAHDNLGVMTVVDRWGAVLLLRYSPHQEQEMQAFLEEIQEVVRVELLPDIFCLTTNELAVKDECAENTTRCNTCV